MRTPAINITSKKGKIFAAIFALGVLYTLIIVVRSIFFFVDNSYTPIKSNISEKDLNVYPFDVGFCEQDCKVIQTDFVKLDSNNVYQVDKSKVRNLTSGGGTHYVPVTVALYALAHHTRFVRYNDPKDEALFLSNANWFRETISEDGCWIYHFDLLKSKAPWCSGMAQGLGLSALMRAYTHTGDESYLDAAKQALRTFELDNKYTVTHITDDGYHFYEETSAKDQPIQILNGFLFAMIGLRDMELMGGSIAAGEYYQQSIRTFKQYALEWETGNWSLYSLDPESNLRNHYRYVSPHYQRLHVVMLQALADQTGIKDFQEAYVRHLDYLENSWVNAIIIPAYLVYRDLSAVVKTVRNLFD